VPGHVFISYRHGDEVPYVQRLTDHLTNEGVFVWFDREIVAGDRWDHVIRLKIDTCAALVVVMTPQAEESDWVAREIDQAELMNKPIFPLLLDGRRFFRLSNLQYEDVTGARMPKPSFVARLRAISAGEPLSARATVTPSSTTEPAAEPAPGSPLVARPIITIPTPTKPGAAIAVSPDGTSLAVAPGGAGSGGGNTVHVYDTTTWRERFAVRQHWSRDLATINAVAFSPNGAFMTTGGREIRGVFRPTSRAIIQNWGSESAVNLNWVTWSERHNDVVRSFAYSPDGHRLAICCFDSTTVDVRLVSQSTNIFRVAHGDTVEGAAFSRDRRWLATASVDRTARICDARTGQQRFMLEHEHHVWAVAFSHNSRLLATASTPVYIWDVRTGEELHRLWTEPESVSNLVRGVAFSRDDRWLAAAGRDMTVRVWDPRTGAQLVKITHDSPARSVVFDPNGRWLANSTDDGRVHVWQLQATVDHEPRATKTR
jgi:hypothetical protein